jgi:hypothetical protein
VHSKVGSLFTYQFSQAWLDLRGTVDADGLAWFENSRRASVAARRYCIDNPEGSRTYGPDSWGLTACNGPTGYSGSYGAPPSGWDGVPVFRNDGTIPPCGAAGSLPFTPEESTAALAHYAALPRLSGRYGFVDAYNLDVDWYDTRVIGIDKGITLLMIENFATGLPWALFGASATARRGLRACGILPEHAARDGQGAAPGPDRRGPRGPGA